MGMPLLDIGFLQGITNLSTDQARCCLTSAIGQEMVLHRHMAVIIAPIFLNDGQKNIKQKQNNPKFLKHIVDKQIILNTKKIQ